MERRIHSREFKLRIVQQLASGGKRPAQVGREAVIARLEHAIQLLQA